MAHFFEASFLRKQVETGSLRADDSFVRSIPGISRSTPALFAILLGLLSLISAPMFAAVSDEPVFPVLDTGSQIYSNVTVVSKSATHVFIKHSRGFAGLKLTELNHQSLVTLGLVKEEPPPAPPFKMPSVKISNPLPQFDLQPTVHEEDGRIAIGLRGQSFSFDAKVLREMSREILYCAGLLYLLFCYCSMLICRKAGIKASVSCFIPIIQFIPLLRAAGMSGWTFLLLFLPVINAIISIIWCFKIARVRGKSWLTSIFLLLPVTNILAFFYLALSGDGSDSTPTRIQFDAPSPASRGA